MNTLIAITAIGVLTLIFEILNFRKALISLTIIGLLAVLGFTYSEFNNPESYYNNMIVVSKYSSAFSALFIILTCFIVAFAHDFYNDQPTKISDFIAIKIFMLAGAVAMVSFGNLAMFFLGIEILSISLYILAASERLNIKSNESGIKYFLMGSFASAILLFGICLIYGAMGTFDIAEIAAWSHSDELPIWFPIGIVMVTIGMLFKIAAVPFHFWAPDVYEGAPTLTTATMSTLVKVVTMATLYKLVSTMSSDLSESYVNVILAVSFASMSLGNIMALKQNNVKRMLAFSGISHAGFMLMTLLSLTTAAGSLLYYSAAYSLAGIAAFAVILYVWKNKHNEDIKNFNGLGKNNPLMAAVLTASLLSMAGIPIFGGFFAKMFLFNITIQSGYLLLVIVAVINSIISVGYYFKLIIAMYFKEPNEDVQPTPFVYYAVAVIAILLNIALGLYPSAVLDLLG